MLPAATLSAGAATPTVTASNPNGNVDQTHLMTVKIKIFMSMTHIQTFHLQKTLRAIVLLPTIGI